jgi:hypothetical protein
MTLSTKTAVPVRTSSSRAGSLLRVISFTAALLVTATPAPAETPARNAAVSWAIEHRQEAFDLLMPAATTFAAEQGEIAISVRRAGFEDRFELLLKIGKREGRAPEATLIIPSGAPLVVQLARARLAGALSLDTALQSVKLDRKFLAPGVAVHLFDALMAARVPLRPQTGLFLHRPHFEINIIGSSELRLDVYDDGTNSAFRPVIRAVTSALREAGVTEDSLSFDPQKYYGGE